MAVQRIRQVRAAPPLRGGGGITATQVRIFDFDPDNPDDPNHDYGPGPGDVRVGFEVQPHEWQDSTRTT
jgi:hypothetical protein